MIIHRLMFSFRRIRSEEGKKAFFLLQAHDAIGWIRRNGAVLDQSTSVLDLGCGYGDIGGQLAKMGCQVTLSDDDSFVRSEYKDIPFKPLNIDRDDLASLGTYDLVVCSNVLEHLPKPDRLIKNIPKLLKPTGMFYLSWTNWLSPYGGHEYAPFHYLGARLAQSVNDKWLRHARTHTIYKDLFPTHIGRTLKQVKSVPDLRIIRRAPRYYPEFRFIMHVPVLREFLAWNCVFLLGRR